MLNVALDSRSNPLFEENLALADIAAKYWSKRTRLEYDDCMQLAYIGLFNASKTYNKNDDSNACFKTWAHIHINNSIKNELRKLNRRSLEISMPTDEDGNEMETNGEYDARYDIIENKVTLSPVKDRIKKLLTDREWDILYSTSVKGIEQHVLAKRYNIQQPHVSRILKNIRRTVIDNGCVTSFLRW